MRGIKLSEDMLEGKVRLNGVTRTITEIRTKDKVVWPAGHVTTHRLINPVVHFSSGSVLLPDQSNYCYLTASYNTYEDGVLVDSQTVTLTPYDISGYPITKSGNSIIWDKDNYGTTAYSEGTASVNGKYAGLTVETYASFTVGGNTYTTSYQYDKTFDFPSLAGDIPAAGGTYAFFATSYRTTILTWTSGETQTGSRTGHSSTISVTGGATTDTYSVNGSTSGQMTFPQNTHTSTKAFYVTLSSSASGSKVFQFTQSAAEEYYLTISPASWQAQGEAGTQTISVSTNLPSYSITSNQSWLTFTKSGNTVTASVAKNETGLERNAALTFSYGGTTYATFTVNQQTVEVKYIYFYPYSGSVPGRGGMVSVTVTTNVPEEDIVFESDSWISTTYDGALGILEVTAGINPGGARTGGVVAYVDGVALAAFSLAQAEVTHYVELYPTEDTFSRAGDTKLVLVDTDMEDSDLVFSYPIWISVSYNAVTGMQVTATRNTTGASRRGVVTVSAFGTTYATYIVNQ